MYKFNMNTGKYEVYTQEQVIDYETGESRLEDVCIECETMLEAIRKDKGGRLYV